MKVQTDRLMDPNRKLPFPEFNFLLNMEHYNDSENIVSNYIK